MGSIRAAALVLVTAAALSPLPSAAVPFQNGDFSAGLTGWNTPTTNGSVAVAGGVAELDTGVGVNLFSAILVQGDDGSFSFATPITLGITDNFLLFDVHFVDLGFEDEGGAGLFDDTLSVSVYDALDFNLDLLFGSVASLADAGPKQVVLDVSSLAGRDVALSFELSDERDDRNSRARIDNVSFVETAPTTTPLPLPGTLALLLAGFSLLAVRARRGR